MPFNRLKNKIYHYLILLNTTIISLILFAYIYLNNKYNNNSLIEPKRKRIRHPYDIFYPHKVFIESHCGINREIFQNTIESFSKSIEYNIDSIETDLWLSKDNVSVLVHGNKYGYLENYFIQGGNVKRLTWKELSTFKTLNGNLSLPRLVDLFKLAKNKLFINLEIKDPRVELVFPNLIKLIEEYDFFDQISLSSLCFDYYKLIENYNKNNTKKIVFGFIYLKNMQKYYDFTKKGNTLNIHWSDITKEICDKAHKNGMAVKAWFKIKEEDNIPHYKKLIDDGVDAIIVNYPLIAKKYIDSIYDKEK